MGAQQPFRVFGAIILMALASACGGTAIFGPIGTSLANPLTVQVNSTTQRAYVVNANDKFLYTSGSLHVVNLATVTAPTRVNSVEITSFGGQIHLDATNNFAYVPNRFSSDDTDTVDTLLQINVTEGATNFLSVSTIDANGNPFGATVNTSSGQLLVPSQEGTLEIYTIGAGSPSREAQVDLTQSLSDGSSLSSVPAVEVAVINNGQQAVVTRSTGGILVVNLGEATGTTNAVDYYISDIEGPRGIATDGSAATTTVYVVDVDVADDGTKTNRLHVLNLAALTPDTGNTTTLVKDKDTDTLLTASIAIGNNPQEVVVSAGLARAYVSNLDDDTVSVIDTAANTALTTITVGDEPFGMDFYQQVAGTDTHLLVCNRQANTVSIANLASNAVVGTYQ